MQVGGKQPAYAWRCALPAPEARRIVSDLGPLRCGPRPKPGKIWLLRDRRVAGDLASLRSLLNHTDDYRLEHRGDGLVLVVGKDRWPVEVLAKGW